MFILSEQASDFNYMLQPIWYVSRGTPSIVGRALPPIVSDVNGDGISEVIVVTNDLQIKVSL